ncbi:MAG: pantoate--beta-alanine ligase, partial [Halanaerobiales bacterium]
PIVREEDGVAMSSRNKYLTPEQRKSATSLYRALKQGRKLIKSGERRADKIRVEMKNIIQREEPATIDYVEVADPETLQPLEKVGDNVLLALAVFIGDTRLIDNMQLEL